jgi:isopropylmalate/homocitrate/citramalate synthase
VGVLTPTSTRRIVSILTALFATPLALHFHDDLGLALANTLARLEAGATMAQVTVNGAGERCGNARLEEVAVALRVQYGLDLGMRLDRLPPLCALVHAASRTRPTAQQSLLMERIVTGTFTQAT